jgi:hypothetical protein
MMPPPCPYVVEMSCFYFLKAKGLVGFGHAEGALKMSFIIRDKEDSL